MIRKNCLISDGIYKAPSIYDTPNRTAVESLQSFSCNRDSIRCGGFSSSFAAKQIVGGDAIQIGSLAQQLQRRLLAP